MNRFFLDGDLGTHVSIDGEVIEEETPVDVVVSISMDDVKHCEPFATPFTVFSFDLETSIEHNTILCAAAVIEKMGSGERSRHTFVGDEEDIMKEMTQLVRSSDPDIITGYNIDNFDMQRMLDRMNHHARYGCIL